MPILFSENYFHLYNERMSYCIEITRNKDLVHAYWGKKIASPVVEYQKGGKGMTPVECEEDLGYSLDCLPQEYPVYGTTDLREPALEIELSDGCRVIEPRYVSHKIYAGKPGINGLPAVYTESDAEADTLEITLLDSIAGVEVTLCYTVFADFDAISRSVKIKNTSDKCFYLRRALSMNVDFKDSDYKYLQCYGSHFNEKQVEIARIHKGYQGFDSRRGSSGHFNPPFLAIMEPNADEEKGNVYAFSFVYSGNHTFRIDVDTFDLMRVQVGINPFGFCWKMEPDAVFETPEVVMVYSANGLGAMSRTYHKLYRTRLCRGEHRDALRPILANSWEGINFDINEENAVANAKVAKELGMDMFVVDDGWFGKRVDDTSSLGDWVENRDKLPNGLSGLVEKINGIGLKFGLWFEPEMISENSELFRKHPEWRFAVPNRKPHPFRHQYILNLSMPEVCDYIIEAVSSVLASANIEYVKWDMNRNMSDLFAIQLPPERQGEIYHRYILGLYRVLEEITKRFPDVLFEGCSSGGGRNDPGIMYYMPQSWTSDNTDGLERIHIQYGNSMVYPASSMTAHVSASSHTPFDFRGAVAMAGMFGYELDLCKMTPEEIEKTKEQIALYRKIQPIVTYGDFYRLFPNDDGVVSGWMYVSEDKKTAVVTLVTKIYKTAKGRTRVYLKGLDENAVYRCDGVEYPATNLMYAGIEYFSSRDYQSKMIILEKVG